MNINHQTLKLSSLALVVSTGLASCGGGNGGSNLTGPAASNFLPEDGNNTVESISIISATFDRDMFALTVVDTNFSLISSSGDVVTASVDYDVLANTVSLFPETNLALLTQYTANLKSGMTDLEGNALADTRWQFTTRDGNWQTVETLRQDVGGVFTKPHIATNINGNAVAVWREDSHIWASHFVTDNGWTAAEQIDSSISAKGVQVTLDEEGNAIAVWTQNEGTIRNVWSNRFTPNTGWGISERIEIASGRGDANNNESGLQIASDTNGNTIAVWYRQDGDDYYIWSNRFTPSNGWGVAEQIDSDGLFPKIVIDNAGNAMATWWKVTTSNTDDNVYYSKRFTPSMGWDSTAQLIEVGQSVSLGVLKFDDDNNAIVILSNRSSLWVKRYSIIDGWSMAEPIERSDNFFSRIFSPEITIDRNGRMLALWKERDETSRTNLWANHFTEIEGWGDAELIEMNDVRDVEANHLVTDKNGNSIAIWQQSDGLRRNLWTNRFTVDGGWETAKLVEIENGGSVDDSVIVMGDDGSALVIWKQYNGAGYDLKLNRFE